jgi:hypothetical protein
MRSWSRRSLQDTARRFTFIATKQKLSAAAGAIVVGPRNIPHTFRNIGSQDARLLLTVIPGRFANYFIEVDGVDDADAAARDCWG